MLLQRSTSENNNSFAAVFEKEFHIEPEYLENEEIKHELRVRNINGNGDRRTITGRLRACLLEEQKSPGAHALYPVGAPADEFQHCAHGYERLKASLPQVTLDPITHDRFMTIFLHFEGRLNRIKRKDKHLNLTDIIFQKNEQFSDLFNEFVQKVRALRRPTRRTDTSPTTGNTTEGDELVAQTHNSRQEQPNAQNAREPSMAVQHVNFDRQDASRVLHQRPNFDTHTGAIPRNNRLNPNAQAFRSIGAHTMPNGQMHPRDTFNINENEIYLDTGNDSNQIAVAPGEIPHTILSNENDGLSQLQQMLRGTDHIPRHANATMNSGDQARLSEHFQPNGFNLLTPIARDSGQSSTDRPQMGINNMNNYDQSQRNNQNIQNNNRLLQVAIPPNDFGENRVNSLPRSFGRSAAQQEHYISGSGQPYDVIGAHACNSYAPQLPNNCPPNPSTNLQPRTNRSAPSTSNHAPSGIQNRPYQSDPNVNFPVPNTSTVPIPHAHHGAPDASNRRRFENDVPNTNYNNHMPRQTDSTDERLELIMASLALLSDEMRSIRLGRNSSESNPSQASVQFNVRQNPSATYTVHNNNDPNTANDIRNIAPSNFPSMPISNGIRNIEPNNFPSMPNFQSLYGNSAPRMTNESLASSFRITSNSVPIHKWNWKFSADKASDVPERRDLAAFLKKLELYREAENLSYEQIHQKFHFLIDGSVYEWYMQYRHNFANWQQLRDGLKKQFTTPLTHFMKVAKLAARRQRKEETAMTYIASIQREFDELGMYSETEKISIIQNGLNDRLRDVALSHTWNSVQDMDLHLRTIEVADELRKETETQAQKRPFFLRRSINAFEANSLNETDESPLGDEQEGIYEGDGNDEIDCQAITTKQSGWPSQRKGGMHKNVMEQNEKMEKRNGSGDNREGRKATCYNCKSELHRLVDCGEPINRIFCFRCGKEGVRAPNCTCGPKNSKSVACSTTESCD